MVIAQPVLAQATQWDELVRMGDAAFDQQQFAQSESAYSKALTEAEKFGPDDDRLADTLLGLARAYRFESKYDEAIGALNRCISLKEKKLGPDSLDVAQLLSKVASIYDVEGKYDEALATCKKAETIAEKSLKQDDPILLTIKDWYAGVLEKKNKAADSQGNAKQTVSPASAPASPEQSGGAK
jgi:tetratricopeptide (TPR) repeat protein